MTSQHIVDLLNRAVQISPAAISDLVEHRVSCTAAVEDDPHLVPAEINGVLTLGMLGIINGIVGIDGEKIVCDQDDYGNVLRFRLIEKAPPVPACGDCGCIEDFTGNSSEKL